jgi:5-methylcytosine-specific restriction endonuclease McrA
MGYQGLDTLIIVIISAAGFFAFWRWVFNVGRKRRDAERIQRRDYYRSYLQSDDWKRKRYVVLKRDNWRCVYCGAPATEVHHLKYAKWNIGKEPIDWLVSVCKSCHNSKHQ